MSTAEIKHMCSKSLYDTKEKNTTIEKTTFLTEETIQRHARELADAKQKYEDALCIVRKKDIEISRLQLRIADIKKLSIDPIPIENQCVICFGYTGKNNVLVPCGHTQYCVQCIDSIKECSICRSVVMQKVAVYN